MVSNVLKLTYTCFIFCIFFPFDSHGLKRERRETHFPGYHFCGPGTKFLERISRGEVGVNKLDEACKVHDSVYEKTSDLRTRMEADDVLANQSWKRVKAGDSSFKEKFAALLVTGVMRVKRIWTSRRLRMQRKGKWYQKIVAFFR